MNRSGSCGGSFYAESGILTSPAADIRSEECIYVIHLQEGNYVNVSIITMDIHCSNFIEIREGFSEDSPIIGKWCGNLSNIPFLVARKNHLRIRLEYNNEYT